MTAVSRPDFLIAGHPKCGSSALYEMLRVHPQIFMPAVKGTALLRPRPRGGPAGGPRAPTTLARGRDLAGAWGYEPDRPRL